MGKISLFALPFIVLFIIFYGFKKKINIYDEFLDGAKEGAIGIVPEELDGSYVTNEFYVLELNKNIITPYFLLLLLTSDTYQGMLRGLSRGATGLSRLPYRSLEDLTIPLPTLKEQLSLTGKMEETRAKINQMEKDWNEALVNFNQKMFGK